MEQRSVVTQTLSPGPVQPATIKYRWMRHFLTTDISPDNRVIVTLQYRAVWIGLALLLQTLNEVDPRFYIPYTRPFGPYLQFMLTLSGLVALWQGVRPITPKQQTQVILLQPRYWQRLVVIAMLALTVAGTVQIGRIVYLCVQPPQYTNDGASLDSNAASLLLQGKNPYTDSQMGKIAQKYNLDPDWTTPLRVGMFANTLVYPTDAEMKIALDKAKEHGNTPEIESKVSYPALSFLSLVPLHLLHTDNVIMFYMLCYLALWGIAWRIARLEMRPWVLVLGLANVPMLGSIIGGNLDIFYTLLLVGAWLSRERRWLSALALGLAFATKQISWFFAPFFLMMIWRQFSLKEACYRLGIAGILAASINLPFFLWNPQAYLAGVLAPQADPMFPMGVGIVGLSVHNLIPFLPGIVYTILEGLGVLAYLGVYWRMCKQRPEAALLLAVLPLFLAWRSLPSYFACTAFPILAVMMARPDRRRKALHPPTAIATEREKQEERPRELPVAVSMRARPLPAFQVWLSILGR